MKGHRSCVLVIASVLAMLLLLPLSWLLPFPHGFAKPPAKRIGFASSMTWPSQSRVMSVGDSGARAARRQAREPFESECRAGPRWAAIRRSEASSACRLLEQRCVIFPHRIRALRVQVAGGAPATPMAPGFFCAFSMMASVSVLAEADVKASAGTAVAGVATAMDARRVELFDVESRPPGAPPAGWYPRLAGAVPVVDVHQSVAVR